MNKEWHKAHPMPKHPTIEQRITWHLEHVKYCHCREGIPAKLQIEMEKRNISFKHIASARPAD